MYNLGLSTALRAEYEETLSTSHRMRVTLVVRNRDEDVIAAIQPHILTGSIQVNAESDVRRSLSLTLLDPGHKLAFDSANPSVMALYADNFLEVKYGVYLAESDVWVDVPVFWGTVTGFSRSGPEVSVEAQGKEALGLDPHLVTSGYTLRKGTTVKAAITAVMQRLGEERFSLGMLSGRLGKSRAVIPKETPWKIITEDLERKASGNMFVFYNGAGQLTAKNRNASSSWTFTTDQLTSQPGFTYDVLSFRNHAEVKGGVKKGSKKIVRGEYSLAPSHPLSPSSMARNSARRFMSTFEETDSLKTDAACRARARALVEAAAFEGVEASFNCLPIPHMEELDTVTLRTDDYSISFRLRSFTLPLTADSTMSVNSTFAARLPGRGK
jgi:hypothetical protein